MGVACMALRPYTQINEQIKILILKFSNITNSEKNSLVPANTLNSSWLGPTFIFFFSSGLATQHAGS